MTEMLTDEELDLLESGLAIWATRKRAVAEIRELRERIDYRWPDDLGWDGVADCVQSLKIKVDQNDKLLSNNAKLRAALERIRRGRPGFWQSQVADAALEGRK